MFTFSCVHVLLTLLFWFRLSLFSCAQGLAFLSERVQFVKLEGGEAASTQLPDVPAPPETVVNTDTKPKE